MIDFEAVVLSPNGDVAFSVGTGHVHSTASVGKLWLLAEVAERIDSGVLDPQSLVHRPVAPAVGDSGLWQYLVTTALPVVDAAVLVAAVSDNAATNALLDVVALADIDARAQALGAERSRLHDRVRDRRGVNDAPMLSSGVVDELAEAARRIHLAAGGAWGHGLSPSAALRLERWLVAGVDTSMVLDPLHLDPLAHASAGAGVRAWSKTGSDPGVRADVGVVAGREGWWAYAAIAEWSGEQRDGVREARRLMRDVGRRLLP